MPKKQLTLHGTNIKKALENHKEAVKEQYSRQRNTPLTRIGPSANAKFTKP